MCDEMQPCTSTLGTQEEEEMNDEEEEEEIDIYDPGDSNPYTHAYIFKHEPFRYIPGPYYPEDGFSPPCLVFGVGLLCNEAIAYAEEHSLMGPPGSEYSATRLFLGFHYLAKHFSELYAPGRKPRITAESVLSLKCDVVLALFDNYSRPVERRREVRDIMEKLVNVFPAAFTRQGYFFSAMNETMYPPGYCRLLYKE